jgi:hypothetical protein
MKAGSHGERNVNCRQGNRIEHDADYKGIGFQCAGLSHDLSLYRHDSPLE